MKNDLKSIMDAELTALSWTREKSDRVIAAARGGRRRGVRRSFALVLALVLVLAALGALALTLINPFAEKVMEMEHENGSFSEWTLDEKLALMAAMEEYGIDTSALPDVSRLPEDEASAALGAAIEGMFAGEIASLHFNILEKAKGFFDGWSLEDKAWYGELMLKYGLATRPKDCVYALPDENAVTQADAYARACQKLEEAFQPDAAALSALTVYPFYFRYFADTETFYWKFHWRNAEYELCYSVLLPANGSERGVECWRRPTEAEWDAAMEETERKALAAEAKRNELEREKGLMITWSLEEQAALYPEHYGVPREGEIALEQAFAIARAALPEGTNAPYAYAFFCDNGEGGRYYAVSFFADEAATDALPYSVEIDARTGEILAEYFGNNG